MGTGTARRKGTPMTTMLVGGDFYPARSRKKGLYLVIGANKGQEKKNARLRPEGRITVTVPSEEEREVTGTSRIAFRREDRRKKPQKGSRGGAGRSLTRKADRKTGGRARRPDINVPREKKWQLAAGGKQLGPLWRTRNKTERGWHCCHI